MKLILVLLSFALSGCIVSRPKNQSGTLAEQLNGKNYDSADSVMGVAVLSQKPVTRKFVGKVFCGEGISRVPANNAEVTLTSDGKQLQRASTNTNGSYQLVASVDLETKYQLSARAFCGSQSAALTKLSKSEIEQTFYIK